jgi:hypothetical protein
MVNIKIACTKWLSLCLILLIGLTAQAQDSTTTNNIKLLKALKKNQSKDTLLQISPIDSLTQIKINDSIKLAQNAYQKFQIDSTHKARLKFITKQPVPKRAAMYSALLPGLGQAYNRNYWKIPIVYGGLGTGAWFFIRHYNNYRTYQLAYIYRTDNNPATVDSFEKVYSDNTLLQNRDLARRNLDRVVVYSTVFYTLGIIDALVSAHLKDFDVSKSISMQVAPIIHPQAIGLSCRLHWANNTASKPKLF